MTREEAKIGIKGISNYDYQKEYFIDELYDDFESRTCENCVLFGNCVIRSSLLQANLSLYKFGCTDFERKEQ